MKQAAQVARETAKTAEIRPAGCCSSYLRHALIDRLYKRASTRYHKSECGRQGDETFHVEPGTRGILSALYDIRARDLRVNEVVIVRTFENGKRCRARVRVSGRAKVSTHFGGRPC